MHPMATAMNAIGYDAAALGNHEFNYGLDLLRVFQSQCDHPLLSANTVDWNSGAPIFPPYVIKTVQLHGTSPIRVGILGLVTPGVAIWDKANVEGKAKFPGIVEQAKIFVPRLKAAGADVVIVSCHSGAKTSSSYGDALPYPENASTLLAQQVPGIDAILVGHAHVELTGTVTNEQTGRKVLLVEPLYWGMRVARLDLPLTKVKNRWTVDDQRVAGTLYNANTVDEDAEIAGLVRAAHNKVLDVRQQCHRHLEAGDVGGDVALRGHGGHGLHQLCPGRRGEEGPGRHGRREHPGAVDRRALQQGGGHPGRRRDGPRRRRALHLRQHAARHPVHRRPGAGLPRVLGPVLQAGQRRRPVPGGRGHQRRHAHGAERHTGLQLRHHGRARRAADVRHRHRPARRQPHRRTCSMRVLPSRRTRRSSSPSTTTGSPAAAASRA